MWIISAVIAGLIIGALAKFVMPGRDPGGLLVTIVLGIAGSLVATWLGHRLGWYAAGQKAGWIASVLGAVLILFIYRMFFREREI